MSGLSTRGLTVARGGRTVLEDVSFTAQTGCITAILGQAGAGKTSLLAACAGLLPLQRGAVLIGGQASPGRRGAGVALLQPGLALRADRKLQDALGRLAGRAGKQSLLAACTALGLDPLAGRSVGSLSHGEGLLALAAARIAVSPPAAQQVLLIDEAGSGLDALAASSLLALLRERARQGETLVIATRHAPIALAADHLVLLHEGRLLQAGTPASLYAEPCSAAAALLTGSANFLGGTIRELRPGALLWSGGGRFIQAVDPQTPRPALGSQITLCLRPERLQLLAPGSASGNQLEAVVEAVRPAGPLLDVTLATPAGRLVALSPSWHASIYPAPGLATRLFWENDAATILA
jgi:ABC-type cobalamin/Fe3+-siderophores transport system ATPase subunit